jgi:pimeloyl-ACP methyl ester carboxylesterase
MSILCLTGWQQPADALEAIAPGAQHFDYASYTDVEAMLRDLPKTPDLAIGWSLGGQLLVRAIAGGHVKPKALMLLAAPFQFIADEGFPRSMPAATFQEFRTGYRASPEETLRQFHTLLALGDTKAKPITTALNATRQAWKHGLFWLDVLAAFSCEQVDFNAFPPTTVIHGLKDKVADPANAEAFSKRISHARLLPWDNCAHAPHMHDAEALREIVRAHV